MRSKDVDVDVACGTQSPHHIHTITFTLLTRSAFHRIG